MKFSMKFALVTGLQVLCLIGMIGFKYRSLATGTKIVLEVPRPKDPRSLFRGDYVIIRYAINRLDLEKLELDLKNVENLMYGSKVYVVLEQKGEVWAPVSVTDRKPSDDVMFIRGKVKTINRSGESGISLSVEYGIEQCYVTEDTGLAMEDQLREVRKAIVSVDPDGKATFVRVPKPPKKDE